VFTVVLLSNNLLESDNTYQEWTYHDDILSIQ